MRAAAQNFQCLLLFVHQRYQREPCTQRQKDHKYVIETNVR